MKNLFGVNITESKKNEVIDGSDFITKRLSPELQNKFDFCFYGRESQRESLPLPLMIIQILSGIFLAATLLTYLRIIFYSDLTLIKAFRIAPYIDIAAIINVFIFIFLKILEKLKQKQVIMRAKNTVSSDDLCEKVIEECSDELRIPDDTETELIEVLKFKYKIKNGKDKLISFGAYDYAHPEYISYIQDENLCFTDYDWVMSIPINSINNIIKAKEPARLFYWDKSDRITSEKYKKYEIIQSDNDIYFAYYYKIQIHDIKGDFELFVPNYDIDKIIDMTHLRIEEDLLF